MNIPVRLSLYTWRALYKIGSWEWNGLSKGSTLKFWQVLLSALWKDCIILTWTSATWDENVLLPYITSLCPPHQHWILKIIYTFASIIDEEMYFCVLICISIDPWEMRPLLFVSLRVSVCELCNCPLLLGCLCWHIFEFVTVNRFYSSLTCVFTI